MLRIQVNLGLEAFPIYRLTDNKKCVILFIQSTILQPFRHKRNKMANITVKHIPDDLYAKLKASALRNRRSINNEIIIWMERAAGIATQTDVEGRIVRARALRAQIEGFIANADEISRAKNEGRLTNLDQL